MPRRGRYFPDRAAARAETFSNARVRADLHWRRAVAAAARLDRGLAAAANRARRRCLARSSEENGTTDCETTTTAATWLDLFLEGDWLTAEQQEALVLMAQRMPDLELAGEVTWKPSSVGIFGPDHLPIRFTPT